MGIDCEMGERMTSPDEAAILKAGINECVDELERHGFDRGQIGAAMAGIGLALTQVHSGNAKAIAIVNSVRDALMADTQGNSA